MKSSGDITPPQWSLRILRVFIRREFLEEIEGDMEEEFRDNVELLGERQARRKYLWETVKLLRPVLLRHVKLFEHVIRMSMLTNYLKVSLRGLIKSPVNSFTNVFGLSMAIGFSILVYGYAHWVVTTDQFHENKNEVFLVTFSADRDGKMQRYGTTPRPLAEMMREDFAAIRNVCRVEDRQAVVKYKDNVLHERVRFTDPSFLDMLTFPLKSGSAITLADVNSVIISEPIAIKYFGEENPIGQSMLIKFNQGTGKEFKVTGVAAKFPDAATIDFDFLLNFENFRTDTDYDFHAWDKQVDATLVQVNHADDINTISQGMDKYKDQLNLVVSEDWAISSFGFESIATLYKNGDQIKGDISGNAASNYKAMFFLGPVAIFLITLACFNYINIAIVSATRRLKEIGIRKSIGATRKVVIAQFLSENLLVTFFATLLGLLFGAFAIIPWFERMNFFTMGFSLADGSLWIYLALIMVVTTLGSGIYPSLYISRFQVVNILKGSVQFGRKNPITRVLLGFQLILACIFVTNAVMFSRNSTYLEERSWGYNEEETMYMPVPDQAAFEKLSAAISPETEVLSVAGSAHHIGKSHTTAIMHFAEKEFEVDRVGVDAKYLATLGIPISEGRGFADHENADRHAVIVNRTLVENLLLTEPVGKTFRMDSVQYEVVGVVEDFHSYSFSRLLRPLMFTRADKADFKFMTVKISPDKKLEAFRKVEEKWLQLFPETPFNGAFQEDVWGLYKLTIGNHGRVWRALAFIALFLAAMGLYGLLSLNVTARVKEFSIRKILGAGMFNITSGIVKQYAALLVISIVVGAPISFFLLTFLFDMAYVYHLPVTPGSIGVGLMILIAIVFITFATQIGKAWKINAVDGLKTE